MKAWALEYKKDNGDWTVWPDGIDRLYVFDVEIAAMSVLRKFLKNGLGIWRVREVEIK